MTATILWHNQAFEVETPVAVKDALAQLHLASESYMVLREGEVITGDEMLQDGDTAKLIPVMIGG